MIFKEYHDRMLIERPKAIAAITSAFRIHPAVALTGPRQCGKTTLARMFAGNEPTVSFFDLERAVDRRKLGSPEQTLSQLTDLQLARLWIIYPGHEAYELDKTISVVPAKQIPALVRRLVA